MSDEIRARLIGLRNSLVLAAEQPHSNMVETLRTHFIDLIDIVMSEDPDSTDEPKPTDPAQEE